MPTRISCAVLLSLSLLSLHAQSPSTNTPPRRSGPVRSPEIHEDGKVTFRLRAPEAREVQVAGEWSGGPATLSKNEEGVWTATVGPLEPNLYGYSFVVDKLRIADPGNPEVKPMRSPTTSILDIPGNPPRIHDLRQVPHGAVASRHYYNDQLGIWRRVHVYTPPGYNDSRGDYPVLYLFHGSGDNDATWSELGRAGVILDNLIADKRAVPMIIVMPDGHPLAGQITGGVGLGVIQNNVEAFTRDLLNEVIPLVEREYRASRRREDRAIAGLSMGGGQSLHAGLNHPELFNYVAGFSSFVINPSEARFTVFDARNKPALIWMACGREDRLVDNAKELSENLSKQGIRHELVITEGNHSWPVWRKYLAQFAPKLFQKN